jgi:hypothetical protein
VTIPVAKPDPGATQNALPMFDRFAMSAHVNPVNGVTRCFQDFASSFDGFCVRLRVVGRGDAVDFVQEFDRLLAHHSKSHGELQQLENFRPNWFDNLEFPE